MAYLEPNQPLTILAVLWHMPPPSPADDLVLLHASGSSNCSCCCMRSSVSPLLPLCQLMEVVPANHSSSVPSAAVFLSNAFLQVTVELKLGLPQVAVIGSQSSGKSSVLEALVSSRKSCTDCCMSSRHQGRLRVFRLQQQHALFIITAHVGRSLPHGQLLYTATSWHTSHRQAQDDQSAQFGIRQHSTADCNTGTLNTCAALANLALIGLSCRLAKTSCPGALISAPADPLYCSLSRLLLHPQQQLVNQQNGESSCMHLARCSMTLRRSEQRFRARQTGCQVATRTSVISQSG